MNKKYSGMRRNGQKLFLEEYKRIRSLKHVTTWKWCLTFSRRWRFKSRSFGLWCSVVGYQLQNADVLRCYSTASQPRRPRLEKFRYTSGKLNRKI